MTLGQHQRLFTQLIAKLILYAYEQGYELTFGDAYRNPKVFGELGESKGYGRPSSNHKRRLAVDLNLFMDGKYLRTTEAHEPLGMYWESLHELCVWGGRFDDGNHYSLFYKGYR